MDMFTVQFLLTCAYELIKMPYFVLNRIFGYNNNYSEITRDFRVACVMREHTQPETVVEVRLRCME